ncbi:MAG: DUF1697 domain-containing protein [Steroidobacteraceae bacterium]
MSTWIALFRGVNVSGHKPLPMKALAARLEADCGFAQVRTYIQSGNVVFGSRLRTAASVATRLGDVVERGFGFRPAIIVLTQAQLERAARRNPWCAEADAQPKSVHLWFLERALVPRSVDLASLRSLAEPGEGIELDGAVLYHHAPGGFGVSKIADRVPRVLGVAVTARNWNTVAALRALAGGDGREGRR